MIITTHEDNLDYERFNIYPDNFVPEKKKLKKTWTKTTMDYFENVAIAQFNRNKKDINNNYDLVKGILKAQDFYMDTTTDVRSFMDDIVGEEGLPSHIKHYSIMNPPLNSMVGELTKRPDFSKVKAFDDDSKNEELEAKTKILQQFIRQKAEMQIREELLGQEVEEEEIQQITNEKIAEYMTGYTSIAERWANHILEAVKVEFNIKEKSEEAFRDFLLSAREFHHIYPDNSKLGFNYEVLNPKNVWWLTTPDKKYIKDAYAAGTIHVMELSEIIDRFNLTKEEIDHLRESLKELDIFGSSESNLGKRKAAGESSIKYDTYSKAYVEERLLAESSLQENEDPFTIQGAASNITTFGYKYRVVQAYWISKKNIAKVTYLDEDGIPQVILVDGDDYSPIPNELEVEHGYVNQWWKGLKIGNDVYYTSPLEWAEYCPIIGVVHEIKNTEVRSLVDLMKPLQILYNVCMNQLFELLEKEIGVVGVVPIRRIPTPKDGDGQDSLDLFEIEAKRKGLMYDDDSPENTKAPVSNTNVVKAVDLNRSAEIQSRYNLAVTLKNECWELVGFSRERLGGSMGSTQTATSIQNSVSRSYNQTEPYFVQHEYVMNQVYQCLLDLAQYIESEKPTSTISYVNSTGEQSFIQVNGKELRGRDLKLFVTSRAEDQRMFEELRQLAQPMLQNGASIYDVSVLYSTNSIRQMKDTFKRLKEQQEAMQKQAQEIEQQKLEQEQQAMQAQIQAQVEEKERDRQHENLNNELDRLNKKEVALISQLGRNPQATQDTDSSGLADALEITKMTNEQMRVQREHQMKAQELMIKNKEASNKVFLELEKLKVERENMKNDEKIAKMQLQAAKAKAKQTTKKKK